MPLSNLHFLHCDVMRSTSSIKALFLSRQANTPPPFHSLFCESNFPNLTYLERTTKPASPRSQNRRCIVMVFERYEIALCHHDAHQVLPSFQFQPPNRFFYRVRSAERPLSRAKWITLSPQRRKFYRLSISCQSVCLL